ncbi:3-dehydroquinate dehydratase, type II [Clostridium argentinense CDC 2741]|uniref:3-dehydroquinate dehydratase n=1 Tax=Clostridium argentinense CDC 2741 TaxID=1418104 RepID=A0A0C1RA05_9CLOT|nr:type II 3-dehydroquinate dehydratase [Clostridium argentinense]ARC85242.1 type II 3-dehydroquinate dehydratase [Clostridium argentinense]KIE47281.1 3-dehydroquinate dehydratase, type II [Clostridium argentinense CDC 2741]NFF39452.1 type II 3-dehydroquinate dehydratase [Clostridium argentinense]NFP51001.1 type II 3-dehydroquinate dehydratase [Clostridium argentinense]NFP73605.1 type II 3-dehydroquinate dehydratase [Clostridium argentinense]
MNILVVNGPNLNLLGNRENSIYGDLTLQQINEQIKNRFKDTNINVDFYQSNYEGDIISKLHSAIDVYDGVVINPGAYSHYSIAILDAIRAYNIVTIEVHLSNIYKREEYRRNSVISEGCYGVISGFGHYGYIMAIEAIINTLQK